MINRTDLLVKMGVYMPFDTLVNKIEECILEAAEQNKREIAYTIPEKTNKSMIDGLVSYLCDLDYIVDCDLICDTKYFLPGKKLIIQW